MPHQRLVPILGPRAGREHDGGERPRALRFGEGAGERNVIGAAGYGNSECFVRQRSPGFLWTWHRGHRALGAGELQRHGSVVLREYADQPIAVEACRVACFEPRNAEDDRVARDADGVYRDAGGVLVGTVAGRAPASSGALHMHDYGEPHLKRSLPIPGRGRGSSSAGLPDEVEWAAASVLGPCPRERAVFHPSDIARVNAWKRDLERVAFDLDGAGPDVARVLIRAVHCCRPSRAVALDSEREPKRADHERALPGACERRLRGRGGGAAPGWSRRPGRGGRTGSEKTSEDDGRGPSQRRWHRQVGCVPSRPGLHHRTREFHARTLPSRPSRCQSVEFAKEQPQQDANGYLDQKPHPRVQA